MSIKENLDRDLKEALKSKDEARLSAIRMLKAAIRNKEVELIKKELDDSTIFQVLSKMIKQREESIEQFEKGGRKELADKERKELKILNAYLPQQMTEAEILVQIEEAVKEVSAESPKDMGRVMKVLVPKLAGRADVKLVSGLVQKRLQPK